MEERRQTAYTIGEGMELPSKGLIYSQPVNAYIELRSMSGRDEMKVLSPSTNQFKILSDVIEGCCIEKPAVRVYDMALGDYEFLLHKLRIITYGDSYKMAQKCPYCGKVFETVAHLEELEVKEFDINKFNELSNVKLPKCGSEVHLKFQTPRILDEIESKTRDLQRKFNNTEFDLNLLVSLLTAIDTVDGIKMDQTKLETFINNMDAADMVKIVNSLDELNSLVGIDNRLWVDCPHCGGEVRTSFRYGPEFFKPTTV